jgi:hypothetical protein
MLMESRRWYLYTTCIDGGLSGRVVIHYRLICVSGLSVLNVWRRRCRLKHFTPEIPIC